MRRSLRISTHLLTLLLCGSGIPAWAEVYQWTDAEGRVHFGDRPPQTGARTVPLPESRESPESPGAPAATSGERLEKQHKLLRAFEEERRQDRDAHEQAQRDKAERERNCNEARERLQTYERSSALYDLDAQGERIYVDETQREQIIAEQRKAVKDLCGKP